MEADLMMESENYCGCPSKLHSVEDDGLASEEYKTIELSLNYTTTIAEV